MKIVSLTSSSKQSARVKALIKTWRERIESFPEKNFLLEVCEDRIQFQSSGTKKIRPFSVDFLTGKNYYRLKHGGGKSQVIAKAVGIKKGTHPSIVDASAGFGRDSFVWASLGCRVHMLERSPVVALLLTDGLERASQDKTIGKWVSKRLTLKFQDSLEGLNDLPFIPDVIYLDPMFAKKKKNALVKQEMRILQTLAGSDEDSGSLLNIALQKAQNRVVVKRSDTALWMNNQEPNMSLKTKKNRFDLYLI